MMTNYLNSIHKQFEYYKLLGERTLSQLDEKDLFWQYNEVSNSIAILMNHLSGNMKSRWTDFLIADGEKVWRHRDQEFEDIIKTKRELEEKWAKGWACLFEALATISENNFSKKIFIRNQAHTILEAINRQLAHYAYHVGEIVFIGKMIKGRNWMSLSIPKGESALFNAQKFAKGKHDGHFTDNFLDTDK